MKISNLNEREQLIKTFELFGHILTKSQYQIFYLYYIEDLSLSEIADIIATTRSNVYDSLKKSKKKLTLFSKNLW